MNLNIYQVVIFRSLVGQLVISTVFTLLCMAFSVNFGLGFLCAMLSVLLPSAVASVILIFRLRNEVVRNKAAQNMFAVILPMALRTLGTLVLMAMCLVSVENLDGLAFVAGLIVTVNVPLLLQLWKIT